MKFLDPDTESAIRAFIARLPTQRRARRNCPLTLSPLIGDFRRKAERALVSARENWRQLRQQNVGATKGVSHSKDADRGVEEDQSHSIDDDLDQ